MKEIKFTPSGKNRLLLQSYAFTLIRGDLGMFEQRLILRLVEAANTTGVTLGLDFKHKKDLRQIETTRVTNDLFSPENIITIPKTALLSSPSEYTKLHKDIDACKKKSISYEISKDEWITIPLVTSISYDKDGINVQVGERFWEALLNFTTGFRKFELYRALSFKRKYSTRLYLLLSLQQFPLKFSIKDLKEMFGLVKKDKDGVIKEKYSGKPSDFIKYVIKPAQEELNNNSPYTFTYNLLPINNNNKRNEAIVGIEFIPIRQTQFIDKTLSEYDLIMKYSKDLGNFELTIEQVQYLKEKFEFTDDGIRKNWKLWNDLVKRKIDITLQLDIIAVQASNIRPDNPAGFVVSQLKKTINDYDRRTKKD